MDVITAAISAATRPSLSWDTVLDQLRGAPLQIVIILAVAFMARWLLHRSIDTLVKSLVARKQSTTDSGSIAVVDPVPTVELPVMRRGARKAARALTRSGLVDTERQRQRVTTLGSVLRSISSVVVSGIAALMIGQELGFNMAPVIASAGVGGVALGFGAQSLVKDFLSGIFMILEDQYGVGDIVDTGEVVGTVEEVTLRITRLRDMTGIVWYVRNGEIVRIANLSQGWQIAVVDFPVAIDEDPERVITILSTVVEGMEQDPRWRQALLEEPTVAGVESMSGGTMTIRILTKCAPNQHWAVQRDIRERGQVALAKAGIRGPILVPGFAEAGPTAKPTNATTNTSPT